MDFRSAIFGNSEAPWPWPWIWSRSCQRAQHIGIPASHYVTLASSNTEIWPFEIRLILTFCEAWSHVIAFWEEKSARYAWQSPAVAQQAQHMHYAGRWRHPSAAIKSSRLLLARRFMQRGCSISFTRRGASECTARLVPLVTLTFDFWPWHSKSSERKDDAIR